MKERFRKRRKEEHGEEIIVKTEKRYYMIFADKSCKKLLFSQ